VQIAVEQSITLPAGVKITPLKTHSDDRGELTEIFRNEWHDSPLPVHWIVRRIRDNVLRGMHVYRHRWEYLCTVRGEIWVGLHDLRPASSTAKRSAMIRLGDTPLWTLTIPPGVAHGLYSVGESVSVVGASGCPDTGDHRSCRWNEPELALDWPCVAPDVSACDSHAGSYAALRDSVFAAPTTD
jgi:dTDP-4-dehydrorhamnose 3,5-epimerase